MNLDKSEIGGLKIINTANYCILMPCKFKRMLVFFEQYQLCNTS